MTSDLTPGQHPGLESGPETVRVPGQTLGPWAGRPSPACEAWVVDALCAQTDPEAFFPEKGGSPRAAKAVCTLCPVEIECLEWALAHDERFGVWGNTTAQERRDLRARLGYTTTNPDPEGDDAA